MLDKRYKQMKSEGVRFTAIYDKLNTELKKNSAYYYQYIRKNEDKEKK